MKASVLAGLVLGLASACVCAAEQDDSFLSLFPPAEEPGRARSEQPSPKHRGTPFEEQVNEALFNSLVYRTRACMAGQVEAIARLGGTTYERAFVMLVATCGGPLERFLVANSGVSGPVARGLVLAYAEKALKGSPF